MMHFDDEDIHYIGGTLENLYVLKKLYDLGFDVKQGFPLSIIQDVGGYSDSQYSILTGVVQVLFDLSSGPDTLTSDDLDELTDCYANELKLAFKEEESFLEFIVFSPPSIVNLKKDQKKEFKEFLEREFTSVVELTLLEYSSQLVLFSEYICCDFMDTVDSLIKVAQYLEKINGDSYD